MITYQIRREGAFNCSIRIRVPTTSRQGGYTYLQHALECFVTGFTLPLYQSISTQTYVHCYKLYLSQSRCRKEDPLEPLLLSTLYFAANPRQSGIHLRDLGDCKQATQDPRYHGDEPSWAIPATLLVDVRFDQVVS